MPTQPPINPPSSGDPDASAAEFDEFARRAGSSLRESAPEHGADRVIRTAGRQRAVRVAAGGTAAVVLLIGGIMLTQRTGDSEERPSGPPTSVLATTPAPTAASVLDTTLATTTTAAATTLADATTVAPTTTVAELDSAAWLRDYTGNPEGPVSGDPVRIGWTDPRDPVLDALQAFLNEEGGGVGGRPVEFVDCAPLAQECADMFAADPSVIAVADPAGFSFTEIAGRKPVLASALANEPGEPAYYVGPWHGLNVAMATWMRDNTAEGDTVLYLGFGTATNVNAQVAPNRQVVEVIVDPANPAAALTSVDLSAVTAVVVDTFNNGCGEIDVELDRVGLTVPVLGIWCDPVDGWYSIDHGLDLDSPAPESGAAQTLEALASHGFIPTRSDGPLGEYGALIDAVRDVGTLFAIIRLVNEIGGPEAATNDALRSALRGFTGPLIGGAGPVECGYDTTGLVPLDACARYVGLHQYIDGEWEDLPPIDLAG